VNIEVKKIEPVVVLTVDTTAHIRPGNRVTATVRPDRVTPDHLDISHWPKGPAVELNFRDGYASRNGFNPPGTMHFSRSSTARALAQLLLHVADVMEGKE